MIVMIYTDEILLKSEEVCKELHLNIKKLENDIPGWKYLPISVSIVALTTLKTTQLYCLLDIAKAFSNKATTTQALTKATSTAACTLKVSETMKTTTKISETTKTTKKISEATKTTSKAVDTAKATNKATDTAKITTKISDITKATSKAEDTVKLTGKAKCLVGFSLAIDLLDLKYTVDDINNGSKSELAERLREIIRALDDEKMKMEKYGRKLLRKECISAYLKTLLLF